jgi:hypothetical protein
MAKDADDYLVAFKQEMMLNANFYILRRHEDVTPKGHDRIDGLIVIANSPKQARKLAHDQAKKDGGDNEPEIWLESKLTSCKQFGKWQYNRPRVIMTDCTNG